MAVQEFYLSDDMAGPAESALFSLNMLVNTLGGQAYTFAQVEGMLKAAGLKGIRLLEAELPPGCAIMVGTKG
jgi:hypothetical protein